MKNKKTVFGTIILLFALIGICNILNVSALEDPEYTETIIGGHAFEISEIFNEGEVVRIEYEITGGKADLHLYIRNSTGDMITDLGNIADYGIRYFYVPYNDNFRIIFKNDALLTPRDIEINVDVVKSLTITSPISTDIFLTGYNSITWTSTGDISNIYIKLYKNGALLETLDWTANDGYYDWYIYDDEYTDGTDYQIRILDFHDNTIYDYSNYFTIRTETEPEPKTITITSPTSADIIYSGYNHIDWSSTGDIDYVKIELYKGGVFLETISDYESNDGYYYPWYIDENEYVDDPNYQIRISDYYDGSIYDYSSYFAMKCEVYTHDSTEFDDFFLGWLLFIIPPIIVIAIIIIVLVGRHNRKIPRILYDEPKKIPETTYCRECGTEILDKTGDFCSVCGSKIIN